MLSRVCGALRCAPVLLWLAAAAAPALTAGGCGQKGPLVPPAAATAAAEKS